MLAIVISIHGSLMSLRNEIPLRRRRESAKLEQERTASLDYDLQRSGGTKQKKPPKHSESKPPAKKPDH